MGTTKFKIDLADGYFGLRYMVYRRVWFWWEFDTSFPTESEAIDYIHQCRKFPKVFS